MGESWGHTRGTGAESGWPRRKEQGGRGEAGVMEVPGLEHHSLAERRGTRLSGLQLPHLNNGRTLRTKLIGVVRVKQTHRLPPPMWSSVNQLKTRKLRSRGAKQLPQGHTGGRPGHLWLHPPLLQGTHSNSAGPARGGQGCLLSPAGGRTSGVRSGAGKLREPGLHLRACSKLKAVSSGACSLFLVGLHDRRSEKVLTGRNAAASPFEARYSQCV